MLNDPNENELLLKKEKKCYFSGVWRGGTTAQKPCFLSLQIKHIQYFVS